MKHCSQKRGFFVHFLNISHIKIFHVDVVPPNQISLVSCDPLAPEGWAGFEKLRDNGFTFIHISAFSVYELAIFTDLTNCLFYTTDIYLAKKMRFDSHVRHPQCHSSATFCF